MKHGIILGIVFAIALVFFVGAALVLFAEPAECSTWNCVNVTRSDGYGHTQTCQVCCLCGGGLCNCTESCA
jgi:hypothetical protein